MLKHERSPSIIDLKRLSYFITTAEAGSISAAALMLGVAQPTLSENISTLERKLGTKLASRGQRGVVLTEAGTALVEGGKWLVEAADALAAEIRRISCELRGPVSVGLPPTLSLLLSVPLAETIYNEMPEVRLHVAEGLSGSIVEWMEAERIDFGFVYELPDRSRYDAIPIINEELFLISAPDNLPSCVENLDEPQIRLEALGDLPLVLPGASHGSRRFIDRLTRANDVVLNSIIEIDSHPQIVEMVSRASAYGLVPHAGVIAQVAAGNLILVEITNPDCRRTAYLARKRSHAATSASLAVQTTLLKIIQEVAERYQLRATLLPGAFGQQDT